MVHEVVDRIWTDILYVCFALIIKGIFKKNDSTTE